MHSLLRFGIAALLATVITAPAWAQNRNLADLKTEVAAIKEEVAKLSAQSPTISEAVTELTTRLTQLEQRLDTLQREQASIPEAVAAIDELEKVTNALRADVENVITRLGDLEQPAPTAGGGGVSYDDGFGWTSEDGKYRLRLGGFVRVGLEGVLAEDASGDIENASNDITLAATRVWASGSTERGSFFLQIDPRLDRSLLDYYMRIPVPSFTDAAHFAVKIGQDRNRYTRNHTARDSDLLFAKRPQAIDDFRYDRSPGVGFEAWALEDRLYGYVGVTNGNGPGRLNDNLDSATFVRVEAAVLGKRPGRMKYVDLERSADPVVVVGGGFVHDLVAVPTTVAGIEVGQRDVDADGSVDNVRVLSASADVLFRWRGFELVGEWLFRHEDWGTVFDHPDNAAVADLFQFDDSRNYMAFYGDASYALTKHFVLGGRAGHHRQTILGLDGRGKQTVPLSDRLFEASAVGAFYWGQGQRRLASIEVTYFNNNNKDTAEVENDEAVRVITEFQFVW